MDSTIVSPRLLERRSALSRSREALCMAVAGLLSVVVLLFYIATLEELVARAPGAAATAGTNQTATVVASQTIGLVPERR